MEDFKELFRQYLNGQLSPEAAARVLEQLQANSDIVSEELSGQLKVNARSEGHPLQESRLFNGIMEKARKEQHQATIYRRIGWWAAAAVLAGAIATVIWLPAGKQPDHPLAANEKQDTAALQIPAGRKGAILTLSNGQDISLDSVANGTIAMQSGVKVALNNGQLSYEQDSISNATVFNTLSTPRGREFKITLPDGTAAWLNSASSIKYPAAFTGKERLVEISGEVYFEVANNTQKPFRVKTGKETSIEVLGTRFNINAYTDEKNIVATLATGAIRFNNNQESTILAPGQQGLVSNSHAAGNKHIYVQDADVAQVIAWKDGLFDFNHLPFDQAMRQLSRWYDIDIVYENGIPDVDFEGTLGRDVSLSKILFFLGKVGVQYRLEGRRLIISQ